MKQWTLEELSKHLEINSKDTYSMAIPLAALYKKLYGQFPHFGLSGAQAECADQVLEMLPDQKSNKGFVDGGVLVILGFFGLFAWKLATWKPKISCEEYTKTQVEKLSGRDVREHFYHGHRSKEKP